MRGSTALQGELQPMKIRSQQQPVGAGNCRDSVSRWESSCESVCLLWRDPHSGRSDGTRGHFEWELTPRARWSSRFVVNFYVAASELIVLQRKVKSQGIWCWKFALRLLWRESKLWPRACLCGEMCKEWLITALCSSEPRCDIKPSRCSEQNTVGNTERSFLQAVPLSNIRQAF